MNTKEKETSVVFALAVLVFGIATIHMVAWFINL